MKFSATWCGPCKNIATDVDLMARFVKDKVVSIHVDVDDLRRTARKYKVTSMPTCVLLINGEEAM